MRNLLILLLALMLGAMLPGCRRTPSARLQAMSRAEALMDSFPDSALAVMRGVSIPAEASRREHALYALLLTQALDKNYIDVADDSLIAVADEYYRTTSDTRRQMLSSFYRARVRVNALDY
ncbi:MAG: tetratricopeptide repeat protein, partial [Muribaculaceae bacterium]|nr:tetratricopeptide repeat protein [Muribaculaceae bacterium]